MNKEVDVAVVGATGAVGEAMIDILEQRQFPVRHLYPLASSRSAGKTVRFKGKSLRVTDLAEFDFTGVHIGLLVLAAVCRLSSPQRRPPQGVLLWTIPPTFDVMQIFPW